MANSPGFGRLWGSSTASNLADGLFQVALPLLAVELTRAPGPVAAVTFSLTLPWLLFALPIGAVVDRQDRRRVMLAANLLRTTMLGLLASAVLLDAVSLPVVFLAALLMGIAEVFADTAAQAILPAVVPDEQLEGANARLLGAQTVANGFVGPPLGGALAGIATSLALGASSALYAVAATGLAMLHGAFRPAVQGPRRLRSEIAEGVRFLAGHRLLRTLALVVFVMNIGWGAWLSVIVLYAVTPGPMGLSRFGYGLLYTAVGVGGVTGTLIATATLRLLGRRWAIGADILGTVVMMATPAVTANPWAVGAAAFIGGVGSTMWGVVVTTIRQQAVPAVLLGRVSSAFRLFSFGAATFGAAFAGFTAQAAGLRPVFAIAALLSLLLLVPFFTFVTNEALAASALGRSAHRSSGPSGTG